MKTRSSIGSTAPQTQSLQAELLSPMEDRPAVPPKAPDYNSRMTMELDRPSTAPASGSKRKRQAVDEETGMADGLLEPFDEDSHTPKRSRSQLRQYDGPAEEEDDDDVEAAQPRNVRRKKGSSNLSHLNLRHSAEQQAAKEAEVRGSKFQEGSLTDKPSDKPPSVYMRTNSGTIHDDLMQDYHNGMPTPRGSVDEAVEHEKTMMPQRVADITAENAKKDENKGFFHFGRSFASNFHPVTLWNKIWNEAKEELTQENLEVAERKARQKEEAEVRYAQMKKDGQFGLRPVSSLAIGEPDYAGSCIHTPRDSDVVVEGSRPSYGYKRSVSQASGPMPHVDGYTSASGSELPDTATKPLRGLKSRLHFKKPSLSNIKNDLKRVTSDLNLAALAGNRESSSSLSPVKTEFDNSALKNSQSRYDLKKQNKLSKRVSDLESKLELARRELDDALVQASPMPKLAGKYERFTPTSTLKRPRFVPGKLPSLPSERIFLAEQMGFENDAHEGANEEAEAKLGTGIDVKDFKPQDESNDETLEARDRGRQYPPRASSLLLQDNTNTFNQTSANEDNDSEAPTPTKDKLHPEKQQTSDLTQLESEEIENMDPSNINKFKSDGAAVPAKSAQYSDLDAKLKALENNVKVAQKTVKSKKRKSGAADEDKQYRPRKDSDDDAEWEEATPKKKRKSNGGHSSSPQNKQVKGEKQSSSQSKKGIGGSAKVANGASSSPQSKKGGKQTTILEGTKPAVQNGIFEEQLSTDELARDEPARNSIDSQSQFLDPVYEEEEETSTVPLNGAPSKPSAKATPARYPRHAMRSRSSSPHKRSRSVQPGVEEELMTRAADAAHKHPGRSGRRSVSPPPANGYTKTTIIEEEVTAVPGKAGVPKLPKGVNGSFESLDDALGQATEVEFITSEKQVVGDHEGFEWPDDVF